MTLKEAAQIYVDLVRLEESLAPDQQQAKQEVSALRSKYHDLFSEALREAGIECADRFEATERALELVTCSELTARDNFEYATADGRRYRIEKSMGWHEPSEVPRGAPHVYCKWHAISYDSSQASIWFKIGCNCFFDRVYNRPGEMPKELAIWTVLWLLEDGVPPGGSSYRGVFEEQGLRHTARGAVDDQFGRTRCPTLPNLVERVMCKRMEARAVGSQRQIGSGRPREFWTLEHHPAQRA